MKGKDCKICSNISVPIIGKPYLKSNTKRKGACRHCSPLLTHNGLALGRVVLDHHNDKGEPYWSGRIWFDDTTTLVKKSEELASKKFRKEVKVVQVLLCNAFMEEMQALTAEEEMKDLTAEEKDGNED